MVQLSYINNTGVVNLKKFLVLILALTITFSFSACKKESTSSKSSSITITEKSEIVNIEITQDNWQDYFTIEEMLVTSKNDFGDYGRIEDFSVDFYLNLKNEYADMLHEIDVSIDLSWDLSTEQYEFDITTGKYTVTNHHEPLLTKEFNKICIFKNNSIRYKFSNAKYEFFVSSDTNPYIPCTFFASNFKCNRATGTLSLKTEDSNAR